MEHDRTGIPTTFGVPGYAPPKPTPVPHAVMRARERYGVELDLKGLRALAHRCEQGEGFIITRPSGATVHALVHDGLVMWAIYRSPDIVTFIQPSQGTAACAAANDWRHKMHRKHNRRR